MTYKPKLLTAAELDEMWADYDPAIFTSGDPLTQGVLDCRKLFAHIAALEKQRDELREALEYEAREHNPHCSCRVHPLLARTASEEKP